jgi:preprotein translocase subunit SecD
MTQPENRVRAHPHAWSLLALLVFAGAACQASPEPTAAVRTMTVTLRIPVADKAIIDAAGDVFAKRLKAIGITNFTVDTGDAMRFVMVVPLTFDPTLVDAVLRRHGVFEFVTWPADAPDPATGDPVPAGATPIFDAATEITSAEASTGTANQAILTIKLSPVGARELATYTTQHIGEVLALVLDGAVLAAPRVGSPITGGDLLISFPSAEPPPFPPAALAAIMASGPLPDDWIAQR